MPRPADATAVLVLADGSVIWGVGVGAEGVRVGELCFNTAMTGYQEAMTDPSYAGQIITFTAPHIGNTGANVEDVEAINPAALGCVLREVPTAPSSWRAERSFDDWLRAFNRVGIAGVDTRALTHRIRVSGAPNVALAHSIDGRFDVDALLAQARAWPGLEGMDLARDVSTRQTYRWADGPWSRVGGYAANLAKPGAPHVVAIDFGVKRAILRQLVAAGARVTVVSADATADEVLALEPDGVFLSNGPGDPAATGAYAVPVVQGLLATDLPMFGVCLGHQLIGLAVGGRTVKMHQGHRGANHPVKRLADGAVEITSQNHGFAVEADTLPAGVRASHVSLFDGSLAGLELEGRPVFAVQYHPEASPGPQDSRYLFERFVRSLGVGQAHESH